MESRPIVTGLQSDTGKPRITILGSGNGAVSMAAHISSQGFEVNIYDLPQFRNQLASIESVRQRITLTGDAAGVSNIKKVTADPKEAVNGADLLFLVSRSWADGQDCHKAYVENILPYLKKRQIILNWTSYWSSLRLVKLLKERSAFSDVILGEASIFPYMCERTDNTTVLIRGVKAVLPIAAMPSTDTETLFEKTSKVYPQCVRAPNVLWTALNNTNVPAHVPVILSSLAYWEHTSGDFDFFGYGVTPAVGRIIDAIDRERLALGKALGLDLVAQAEWMKRMYGKYGAKGMDMYEIYSTLESHKTWRYKVDLEALWKFKVFGEDIVNGYVPMASLGDQLGVSTPVIHASIELAAAITGFNPWRDGLTAEKLGLAGLTAKQIVDYANSGER